MIPNEHSRAVATGHFPAKHDEAADGCTALADDGLDEWADGYENGAAEGDAGGRKGFEWGFVAGRRA